MRDVAIAFTCILILGGCTMNHLTPLLDGGVDDATPSDSGPHDGGGCVTGGCRVGSVCDRATGQCHNPCGSIGTDWTCVDGTATRCTHSFVPYRLETRAACDDNRVCRIFDGEPSCVQCEEGHTECTFSGEEVATCTVFGTLEAHACSPGERCSVDSAGVAACHCAYEGAHCGPPGSISGCHDGAPTLNWCTTGVCEELDGIAATCFPLEESHAFRIEGSIHVALPDSALVPVDEQTFALAHTRIVAVRGSELLGYGTTDANGGYAFMARDTSGEPFTISALGMTERSDAVVQLRLVNYDSRTYWSSVLATTEASAGDVVEVGDTVIEGEDAAGAHALFVIDRAMRSTNALFAPEPLPPVAVYFATERWWSCLFATACYREFGPALWPHDALTSQTILIPKTDLYTRGLILHELGHHVAEKYAPLRDTSARGHGAPVPPSAAWNEGYADFFAQAIASLWATTENPNFITESTGTVWDNFETRALHSGAPWDADPSGSIDQPINEYIVSAVLWDLADNTPEEDPVALGFETVLTSIARRPADRGAPFYDLVDQLDALTCVGDVSIANAESIARLSTFPYAASGSCEP